MFVFVVFQTDLQSPPQSCGDADLDEDEDVDAIDLAIFQVYMSGADQRPPASTGGLPDSGTFTLHGRPIDVLSDGTVLQYKYNRARYYDVKNGRWLQRDPKGYIDGPNLYEAFGANPLVNLDPEGEGILTWIFNGDYSQSDAAFLKGFAKGTARSSKHVGIGAGKVAADFVLIFVDGGCMVADVGSNYLFNYSLNYQPLSRPGQAALRAEHTKAKDVWWQMRETAKYGGANLVFVGIPHLVLGTMDYIETGDADALAEDVGGPNVVVLVFVRIAGTNAANTRIKLPSLERLVPKGLRVVGETSGEAARPPGQPAAYSTAFEMRLDPSVLGRSRSVHYNRANTALDAAISADAELAALVEIIMPGARSAVAEVGGRTNPVGWTWEHVTSSMADNQVGIMRLVPSYQHTPGSPWWRVLHPNKEASGGYAEWAIPRGAPANKR